MKIISGESSSTGVQDAFGLRVVICCLMCLEHGKAKTAHPTDATPNRTKRLNVGLKQYFGFDPNVHSSLTVMNELRFTLSMKT